MTADNTSREALARIAIHDVFVNAGRSVAEANDLIEAVVTPLVQERERLREMHACTCGPWHPDADGPNEECPQHGRTVADWIERGDTWHKRWRQLMRDHEAVVKERDILETERDQALAEKARWQAEERERIAVAIADRETWLRGCVDFRADERQIGLINGYREAARIAKGEFGRADRATNSEPGGAP